MKKNTQKSLAMTDMTHENGCSHEISMSTETIRLDRSSMSEIAPELTQMALDNVSYIYMRPCVAIQNLRENKSVMSEDVVTHPTSIMAIDLGTTTGWALRPRDGQITHGFISFKPQRFEGGGMRFLRLKRWLSEIKSLNTDIHAVYFEEVRRHAGVDAAHIYGGLMATLTTWCEHHNIPYQGVPVGTIKKHATGKGNASKEQIIEAMQTQGHAVTDDNEADALALLYWAMAEQEK
jgi:Holliday junction resolvasome RuvABC endonuclease subunit